MTNTNNIMIPRFITLNPIDEQFEARFNTLDIIDYASNGKDSVVHLHQGSTIKTLIVEESVQEIMKLIGDNNDKYYEDNKISTIEIISLKDEVIFTHSVEQNTILKTLEKAVINGFDLRYSNLRDAKLAGAKLADAKFRGADLRDTDLRGADLRDAYLRYADFRGADFRGADLTGANYTQAQIDSAIIDETTIFNQR